MFLFGVWDSFRGGDSSDEDEDEDEARARPLQPEPWRVPKAAAEHEEEEEEEQGYSRSDLCSFLKTVFRDENLTYRGILPTAHAVHALLLESGFVGVDPVTRLQISRFNLPLHWFPTGYTYMYTLPEVLNTGVVLTDDLAVLLKFEKKPSAIRVSGPWNCHSTKYLYTLDINDKKYTATLMYLLRDEQGDTLPEKYAYDMRKVVRKRLALPLITRLCANAGLPGPPLLDLPRELQVKIFELLPRKDIAKLGCVSRQLNRLTSVSLSIV